MFNLSEWLVSGIINGHKSGVVHFSETTNRVANYLTKGLISEAQAEEIAKVCPTPVIEETEVTNEVAENITYSAEEVTEENQQSAEE